jgi:hypothetical protein
LLKHHLSDLALNISRLISNRHLCQTGQVDQRKRKDVGRIYPQVDWRWGNARVATGLGLRLPYNLVPYLAKVVELLAGNVQELAPLVDIVLLVCCLCTLCGAVRL